MRVLSPVAVDHARTPDADTRKAALDAAHTIAHKLHGTAGTYGHAEVSRAIGSVELALERLIGDDGDPAECWQLISVGLERAFESIQ